MTSDLRAAVARLRAWWSKDDKRAHPYYAASSLRERYEMERADTSAVLDALELALVSRHRATQAEQACAHLERGVDDWRRRFDELLRKMPPVTKEPQG